MQIRRRNLRPAEFLLHKILEFRERAAFAEHLFLFRFRRVRRPQFFERQSGHGFARSVGVSVAVDVRIETVETRVLFLAVSGVHL